MSCHESIFYVTRRHTDVVSSCSPLYIKNSFSIKHVCIAEIFGTNASHGTESISLQITTQSPTYINGI